MAPVESFADLSSQIARRVGLLQHGQVLFLDFLKQGHIGAVAGRKDHGKIGLLVMDPGVNLRAIELWKHDVQQNEIDLIAMRLEHLHCLLAVGRDQDLIAQTGERLVGELAKAGVIFHDQKYLLAAANRLIVFDDGGLRLADGADRK